MDIITLSVYTIIQIGLLRIIATTVRREVNDAEKHKKKFVWPCFFLQKHVPYYVPAMNFHDQTYQQSNITFFTNTHCVLRLESAVTLNLI